MRSAARAATFPTAKASVGVRIERLITNEKGAPIAWRAPYSSRYTRPLLFAGSVPFSELRR